MLINFNRHKRQYLITNPSINNNDLYRVSNQEEDDNDPIYKTNKDDIIEDELITYLEERRSNRKVSKYFKVIK